MTDDYAYYLFAESTISSLDRIDFRSRLDMLREYIEAGGRIVEDEPSINFPQWLVDHNILHHYEMVWFTQNGACETLYVVHLYNEQDAFLARLHTNQKPITPGWRATWDRIGFDGFRMGIFIL
jgi:hypothetical protein